VLFLTFFCEGNLGEALPLPVLEVDDGVRGPPPSFSLTKLSGIVSVGRGEWAGVPEYDVVGVWSSLRPLGLELRLRVAM